LEGVVSDIDATLAQRRRAQDGIARSEKMLVQSEPNRLKGVAVIARSTWGAAKARDDRMEKNKGGYTRITVHHSADPNPVALDGTTAKTYEAVREIQKAHMDGKNTHYGDIGYHFVIDPYGRVIAGRDLEWQGAHAYGDNNIQNIGICLIGNFDEERPTQAALDALRREIEELRARYGIAKDHVLGHRELRATECPGKYLMEWIKGYRGSGAAPEAKTGAGGGSGGSGVEKTASKKSVKSSKTLRALH
jgi:N-acetylmuramoyl-L-alanine amidase